MLVEPDCAAESGHFYIVGNTEKYKDSLLLRRAIQYISNEKSGALVLTSCGFPNSSSKAAAWHCRAIRVIMKANWWAISNFGNKWTEPAYHFNGIAIDELVCCGDDSRGVRGQGHTLAVQAAANIQALMVVVVHVMEDWNVRKEQSAFDSRLFPSGRKKNKKTDVPFK